MAKILLSTSEEGRGVDVDGHGDLVGGVHEGCAVGNQQLHLFEPGGSPIGLAYSSFPLEQRVLLEAFINEAFMLNSNRAIQGRGPLRPLTYEEQKGTFLEIIECQRKEKGLRILLVPV